MAKGTDLASIIPNIKEAIKSALQGEIAEYTKEKLIIHAASDVYAEYHPSSYKRRETLTDIKYIDDYMNGELSLTVKPVAPFNPKNATKNSGDELAVLIEYGHGGGGYFYDYPNFEKEYMYPRQYVANTAKELEYDGHLSEIISDYIENAL